MNNYIILEFLNKYYHNVNFICTTGSFSKGSYTKNSDIDVIILTEDKDYFNQYESYHSKTIFQVTLVPVHKLNEAIWLDYSSGEGKLIAMFACAHIIKDQNDLLQQIINKCQHLLKEGPPQPSLDMLKSKCITLKGLYDDIDNARSTAENMITSSLLFNLLIEMYQLRHNKWRFSQRYVYELFDDHFNKYFNELSQVFKQGILTGDYQGLKNISNEYINYIRNKKNVSGKSIGAPYLNTEYFCIQINTTMNSKETQNLETIFHNILSELDLQYFSYLTDIKDDNILIIVTKYTYTILENINKKVFQNDDMHYKIGNQVLFPVEADLYNGIIDIDLIKQIHQLNFLYFDIYKCKDEELPISSITSLVDHILDQLISAEHKNTFCKEAFERYFIATYDNGHLFTHEQIQISKSTYLKIFNDHPKTNSEKQLKLPAAKTIKIETILSAISTLLMSIPVDQLRFRIVDYYSLPEGEIIEHIINRVFQIFRIDENKRSYILYNILYKNEL